MCRFMLIFDILKHGSSTMNFNSFDNIARIIKCDISKSKLALSTCNGVYFSSTALIVFTLYEIKQEKIFLGHPVLQQIQNANSLASLKFDTNSKSIRIDHILIKTYSFWF